MLYREIIAVCSEFYLFIILALKDKAQTALFKDPVRTAL